MTSDGGTWPRGWDKFSALPLPLRIVIWVVAWPVPLVLFTLSRPGRERRPLSLVVIAGLMIWGLIIGVAATTDTDSEPAAVTAPTSTTTDASGDGEDRSTSTAQSSTTTVDDSETEDSGSGASPDDAAGGTALVDQLRVEPEGPRSGYDRDLFPHWIDADGDGCDTRREVLIEESLDPVTVGAGCSLSGGRWFSPFDGVTTADPSTFDVDHFVPLAEAWDSGASVWSPARRRDFANDLGYSGSLIAVSASSNRSKSDRDPAGWKPPAQGYWCTYATTWVEVKLRWDLSADEAEVSVLRSMMDNCSGNQTQPAPSAPEDSTTTTSGSAECDPSYPDVCIPSPPPDLDCSDVEERNFRVEGDDPHGFDGDGNGVGCES